MIATFDRSRIGEKPGFSTFESRCGRETDSLLEGDGFELPILRIIMPAVRCGRGCRARFRRPVRAGSADRPAGSVEIQTGLAENVHGRR